MNARQICATIDFMCFNWLNVYRCCRRRRHHRRRFVFVFFCLSLLCVCMCERLFISFVCDEIALFYFLLQFCLIFSYSLYLSVGELGSTRLALYLLANVYAMWLFFLRSCFFSVRFHWEFAQVIYPCCRHINWWLSCWFFSLRTFQPWNNKIVKYYSGAVNVVYSAHTHVFTKPTYDFKSNLYRNTCESSNVYQQN